MKDFVLWLSNKIQNDEEITWLLDVDDSLLELCKKWIFLYNYNEKDTLEKSSIKTWDIGSYTKIKNAMYDYLYLDDLYSDIECLPDALEAVNTIRSFPKSKIVYCTHVIGHPGQKYQRLFELGFIQEGDSYFEGYSPTSIDKSLFKANVIVDDNYKHVMNFKGEMKLLVTQPWNESYDFENRINNWKEFLDKIKEIA
jgi:5'(3')-deoxyribonucleotidase